MPEEYRTWRYLMGSALQDFFGDPTFLDREEIEGHFPWMGRYRQLRSDFLENHPELKSLPERVIEIFLETAKFYHEYEDVEVNQDSFC